MDCHIDARAVAGGHDTAQKIDQIIKQFFVAHACIGAEQSVQLTLRVAFIPARQMQAMRIQPH